VWLNDITFCYTSNRVKSTFLLILRMRSGCNWIHRLYHLSGTIEFRWRIILAFQEWICLIFRLLLVGLLFENLFLNNLTLDLLILFNLLCMIFIENLLVTISFAFLINLAYLTIVILDSSIRRWHYEAWLRNGSWTSLSTSAIKELELMGSMKVRIDTWHWLVAALWKC
jgi:hypothetical protein